MNKFFLWFTIAAALASIAVRLLPHLPNFAPVGALALFAGVYVARKSKWALLVPLGVMFVSDLFIGFYDLKLMFVVYGSFLFYGFFGFLIRNTKHVGTLALATLAGSSFFYLTTNFAVWAFSSWYPHTLSGLLLSYTLALPFFKYTLLGDLFFTSVLFGVYELAKAYLFKTKPGLVLDN